MSSIAHTNPNYGLGYADSGDPGNPANLPTGEIKIMYTLLGDANLDGTVNSEDFTPFSQNLGLSGMMWDDGDFNYDGTVNAEDFTPLSQNLGQSNQIAAVDVGAGGHPRLLQHRRPHRRSRRQRPTTLSAPCWANMPPK